MIVLNTVVFLFEIAYTNNFSFQKTRQLFAEFGLIPLTIINAVIGIEPLQFFSILSSMFMHYGYLHLIGNMLFLYIFGDNVEDRLGHLAYLCFYLTTGVAAALTQVYVSLLNGFPDLLTVSVGASGAVSGILAAYLVFFPKARVVTLVWYFLLPVRAVWFIGFWFLLQFLYILSGVQTGVAYWAHIGGFVAGLIVAALARVIVGKEQDDYES
jgi:membrane associated rhomboid family serine protease